MLAEDFDCTVQRERLDRVSSASGRGGPKQRVVDRLFSGFDRGEKERRHGIIGEGFEIAGCISLALVEGFDPNIGGCRKRDGVISTAVASGCSRSGKAHDGARG